MAQEEMGTPEKWPGGFPPEIAKRLRAGELEDLGRGLLQPLKYREAAQLGNIGRVLILEDEPPIMDLLDKVLTTMLPKDAVIVKEEDGLGAVDRIMRERFDVFISDLKVPRLHGEDVVVFAKSMRPDMFILIQSGTLEEKVLGADFQLQKPYQLNELTAALGIIDRRIGRKEGAVSPAEVESMIMERADWTADEIARLKLPFESLNLRPSVIYHPPSFYYAGGESPCIFGFEGRETAEGRAEGHQFARINLAIGLQKRHLLKAARFIAVHELMEVSDNRGLVGAPPTDWAPVAGFLGAGAEDAGDRVRRILEGLPPGRALLESMKSGAHEVKMDAAAIRYCGEGVLSREAAQGIGALAHKDILTGHKLRFHVVFEEAAPLLPTHAGSLLELGRGFLDGFRRDCRREKVDADGLRRLAEPIYRSIFRETTIDREGIDRLVSVK
jgi:CheY-like chemotaxis protein